MEEQLVPPHEFKVGMGGLCEHCRKSVRAAIHDPTLNEQAERTVAHNVDTSPTPQRGVTNY